MTLPPPSDPYGAVNSGPQPGSAEPGYRYASPEQSYGLGSDPIMRSTMENGNGVAALVLGVAAVVLCFVFYISIPAAIGAIIFGIKGRRSAARGVASNPGVSLAGIICAGAGVVLTIAVGLLLLWPLLGLRGQF